MEIPNELYTASSLLTLSGSATAVFIITSVIGYLIGGSRGLTIKKWLGLALALIFAFLGATQVNNPDLVTWVVALVNGFLIYLTAVGANTIVGYAATTTAEAPIRETSASAGRSGFADPWF